MHPTFFNPVGHRPRVRGAWWFVLGLATAPLFAPAANAAPIETDAEPAAAPAGFSEASTAEAPPPADDASPAPRPRRFGRLRFDLPALDVRENLVIGFWPSMAQSLALSKDAYYLVHGALLAIPMPDSWSPTVQSIVEAGVLVLVDSYLSYFPPAEGWMHEEWHRAAMSRRGISSYNDIYNFDIGAAFINVSHVRDEDLVRLKREYPAEQVRLSAAGIEGDLMLGLEFDKDRFFLGTRAGTVVTQWLTTANAILYMYTAAFGSDGPTEDANRKEGSNVEVRDFTGLDPDGWVYDLFRPDEPYEARGIHPSGVGIDRYRSESDFTPRERNYLRTQAHLSLLNLVDPQLIGFNAFELGSVGGLPLSFNANLQHLMAPFGYALGLNLFGKAGPYNAFAELRAFVSDSLVLPGLGLELVRYPLPWLGAKLTPRARLWLQPKDQRFFAGSAAPGAALELRANVPLYEPLEFYLEASAKTPGWIPGNVFLDESVNLRLGFEAVVF